MDYRQNINKIVVSHVDLQNSCLTWKNYFVNLFSRSLLTYNIVSLSIWQVYDLDGSPLVSSCRDRNALEVISNRLLNMSSSAFVTKVTCEGSEWVINQCNRKGYSLSICVDCFDPCSSDSYKLIDVCPEKSSRDAESFLNGLIVDFKEPKPLPAVSIERVVASAANSIKVFYKPDMDGLVYCAVFDLGEIPKNIESISSFQFSKYSKLNVVSNISIESLTALTTYDVYCMGISRFGAKSPLQRVLAASKIVKTLCCNSVKVSLLRSSIPEGKDFINLLKISLSSAPFEGLSVAIVLKKEVLINGKWQVQKYASLLPGHLSFNYSNSKDAIVSDISLSSLKSGDYDVSIELAGSSSRDYTVTFLGARVLSVYSVSAPPSAPRMLKAGFSISGLQISIEFVEPTNRGNFGPRLFDCNMLFDFNCSSSSSCVWISPETVLVYIDSRSNCAGVGDMITIQASSELSAECSTAISLPCFEYAKALRHSVGIAKPPVPINPVVSISSPSTIGKCDPFVIDLTGSYGSGGRAWASISIASSILSSSGIIDTKVLDDFLLNNYELSPPTPIPASYFVSNVYYNFAATLCNFLGFCSTENHRLLVLDSSGPLVSIPGLSTRVLFRNSSLSLVSNSQINICQNNASVISYSGMTYQWDVYVNDILQPAISKLSTSRDAATFKLPAYSLQVNTYEVRLTVLFSKSGKSSVVSCKVDVRRSGLDAVLTSYKIQFWVDESAILDASKSRDLDVPVATTGIFAGLSFSWSCMQLEPILSLKCPLFIMPTTRQDIIKVQSKSIFNISRSRITVDIVDPSKSRVASSSAIVDTIFPVRAKVSIIPLKFGMKVNPALELVVNADILIPSSVKGELTWSLEGADLKGMASTPTFYKSIVSGPYSLVIAANKLIPGTFSELSLSAVLSNGQQTTATMSIVVNAVPQPGVFSISPEGGFELSDLFQLSAYGWRDEDIPLSYMFGFYSSKGSLMVIQPKSELSYFSSVLPLGDVVTNFTLRCVAGIFDSYSAAAYSYKTVSVSKMSSNSSIVSEIMNSLLDGAAGSNNKQKQVSSAISSSLNKKDCSMSPNCTVLGRQPCSSVSNTCGPCFVGYFGADGFSNSPCSSIEKLVYDKAEKGGKGLASVSNNTACNDQSDCPFGWQICNTKTTLCEIMEKSCFNNCSTHGVCKFMSRKTQEYIERCSILSFDCDAVCDCEIEYSGESCDMTLQELAVKSSIRQRILDSLGSEVRNVDISDESAVGDFYSSINSVSEQPDQIDDSARESLIQNSKLILDSLSSSGDKVTFSDDYLSFFNNVGKTFLPTQQSNRRRRRRKMGSQNETETSYYYAIASEVESQIRSYTSLLSDGMVGSQSLSSANSVFSMTAHNTDPANLASVLESESKALEVSLPRSSMDMFLGKNASHVAIPVNVASNNNNNNNVKVNLVMMSSSLYSNAESFETDVLHVSMSSLPCDGSQSSQGSKCGFTILQAHTSSSLDSPNPYAYPPPTQFRTRCHFDDYSVHNYTCPEDGLVISASCFGYDTFIVSTCAYNHSVSVCNSLASSLTNDIECTTASFTPEYTTCYCENSNSTTRRLSAYNNKTDSTVSVNIAAMLTTLQVSFVNTLMTADDLNAESLKHGWVATVTMGTLFVIFLSISYFARVLDLKARTVVPMTEQLNKAALLLGPRRLKNGKYALNPNHSLSARNNDKSNSIETQYKSSIQEILPKVMQSKPFLVKVKEELMSYHRYAGIYFHYTPSFPRILRVLSIGSSTLTMLFIQSITYNLTNADDGSCELLVTEQDCLSEASSFQTGETKCWWDPGFRRGSCHFKEPENSMMIVIFVAIFSALINTPAAFLLEWFIMEILSAESIFVSKNKSAIANSNDIALQNMDRRLSLSDKLDQELESVSLEAEVLQLESRLLRYRKTLLGKSSLEEFDDLWGILTNVASEQYEIQRASAGHLPIRDNLATIFSNNRVVLKNELKLLEDPQCSVKAKGKRLLYLFQKDLMSGTSGKILENKFNKDNRVPSKRPASEQLLAIVGMVTVCLSMLFYIYLFAMSQSKKRQGAWFKSFILWLVLDIFVVSTAATVVCNVILPLLTDKDIKKVQERMTSLLTDYEKKVCSSIDNSMKLSSSSSSSSSFSSSSSSSSIFNAAEYLMVSYRLAKLFPDLRESKIILQFSNQLPLQNLKSNLDVKAIYSQKSGILIALLRMALSVLFIFLSSILNLPANIQDIVIQWITVIISGYTLLIHYRLYDIYPALVILPSFFFIWLAHFFIKSSYGQELLELIDKHVIKSNRADDKNNEGKDERISLKGSSNSSNSVGINVASVNLLRSSKRRSRPSISVSVDKNQESDDSSVESNESVSIVYTSGSSYYSSGSTIDDEDEDGDGSKCRDASNSDNKKNRTRDLSDSSDTDESN